MINNLIVKKFSIINRPSFCAVFSPKMERLINESYKNDNLKVINYKDKEQIYSIAKKYCPKGIIDIKEDEFYHGLYNIILTDPRCHNQIKIDEHKSLRNIMSADNLKYNLNKLQSIDRVLNILNVLK